MDLFSCRSTTYVSRCHIRDGKITQITYQDGTVTTESDAEIGQVVEMAGLLRDVSLGRKHAAMPDAYGWEIFCLGPCEERNSPIFGSTPDR
jgi:hypothetical protein